MAWLVKASGLFTGLIYYPAPAAIHTPCPHQSSHLQAADPGSTATKVPQCALPEPDRKDQARFMTDNAVSLKWQAVTSGIFSGGP